MVMSMLTAGGVEPVEGSSPGSFELSGLDAIAALTTGQLAGRSVKLLDHIGIAGPPPAASWRFIWLDRDPVQQAVSHTKFLIAVGAIEPFDNDARLLWLLRDLVASMRRDRPRRLAQLRSLGPVTVLSYEQVLANPGRAARHLAKVAPGLDRPAAMAVVHDRDGVCRPDLAVEAGVLAAGAGS